MNAQDLDLDLEQDRDRICQGVEAAAREVVAALAQLNIPVDEEEVQERMWNDLREKLLAGKLQPKSGTEQ
jgi:hypothetical protein